MTNQKCMLFGLIGAALVVSVILVGPADARRGGSFGSRGMRTYSSPSHTATAPRYVMPVQRSMTQQSPVQAPAPAYGQQYPGSRPGFFGGFGGGMLGGLLAGGLIGGMMGHGWGGGWGGGGGGGGGGLLSLLLQFAIIGGIVWLALKLFRRPSAAVEGPSVGPASSFGAGTVSSGPWGGSPQQFSVPVNEAALQIPIVPGDRDAFEHLLIDIQDAFGHEDYGRLREETTPEVMSYLAEELSQNATHGRRNDVTETRLIQSDVSEAWREGDADYATVALRYESVDVMRDRTSGAVVSGDPDHPTEAIELWTFVRQAGGPWKLSAIQET
jgi:predicted lipid-binding transport protein (Tim44 family)